MLPALAQQQRFSPPSRQGRSASGGFVTVPDSEKVRRS
jgi:hypothetical protein